jgi:hypothetical protein
MAEYDLNGWTAPDLINPGDLTFHGRVSRVAAATEPKAAAKRSKPKAKAVKAKASTARTKAKNGVRK